MCGIVGYFDRSGEPVQPLGATVLGMLRALGCRGPDSAGVALEGLRRPGHWTFRVKLGERGDEGHGARVAEIAGRFGASGIETIGPYARFSVPSAADLVSVTTALEAVSPEVEVVSAGHRLEVSKQVGSPDNLDKTFGISAFEGSHGIGHTRLSTESKVDLSHSQPFWGHGCPDLAIVHNGHITNYHQLRRRYEQRGVRFYTENDSEVIAVYLGERLGLGDTLEAAFHAMMRDMDGSFSCMATTADAIGFIKDPFAFKPLVFAETRGFVAIATEEVAIRAAIPGDYDVVEAAVRHVKVWTV
ncbi:MAG: glutamine phosphoribosylpyrophosphate amidotransferase [Bryobacteraceae bacterium]